MRSWHIVTAWLRSVFFRGRREADLGEELRFTSIARPNGSWLREWTRIRRACRRAARSAASRW